MKYCKNCKYKFAGDFWNYKVKNTVLLNICLYNWDFNKNMNWDGKKEYPVNKECCKLNENCNCKYYKRKQWKFWIKGDK